MPLDFTNTIVPENNLRLPDALTIKYGPAELLARFVLAGDMAARRRGIELRLRHDFDELAYLSKQPIAQRTQFSLMNMFNSPYPPLLAPHTSYSISAHDAIAKYPL